MAKTERQKNIGKYGLIGVILFIVVGISFGLYHDFTKEYEATHKYGPPQYVYDMDTKDVRPYKEGDEYLDSILDVKHERESRNFVIEGNRVVALTKLDEEGMRKQAEDGCGATECHSK